MELTRKLPLAISSYVPAAAGAAAFSLYYISCPPGVGVWDTAEFQTVVWIAGIPHPTGFPAFLITGWLFTHLLPFGNPAWRLSIMAAFATALACGVLVASLRRFGVGHAVALITGALFAVSEVIWIHATRAAVESLVLLFGSLAVANAIVWVHERRQRALVSSSLFLGLAIATHPVALWYIPGFLVLAAAGIRKDAIPWRTLGHGALAALGALSLYAYLPIRSAVIVAKKLDPTTSLGLPPGQQLWNAGNPSTLPNFIAFISGSVYNPASGFHGFYDFSSYPHFFARLEDIVLGQYGAASLTFAIVGITVLLRSWPLLIGLFLMAFFPIPFSMEYSALADAAKYYLVTLWITAWFIGVGTHTLARETPAELASIPALILAIFIGVTFQAQSTSRFAQRFDTNGEAVIETTLLHTEENAIINGQWSYITPIGYAKYVEGRLGDRIPVPVAEKNELLAWSHTRPVYWIGPPDMTIQSIPGAVVTLLPNTWPPLYRVAPAH